MGQRFLRINESDLEGITIQMSTRMVNPKVVSVQKEKRGPKVREPGANTELYRGPEIHFRSKGEVGRRGTTPHHRKQKKKTNQTEQKKKNKRH